MRKHILSIAAILFSTAIFVAGTGLVGVLIPVRGHLNGFTDFAIGMIGSAYYAGFVVGCFAGPQLIARVGHVRTFAIGAALIASTTLLQSMLVNEVFWASMRAFFGFAAAILYMVIESWLNERATNEIRGRIFAAYMTVNYGSLIVGQMLFATARPSSFTLFNLAAAFFALCVIPVSWTQLPQPKPTAVPIPRPLKFYRMAPVGLAGCVAVGLANSAIWTLAPLYAQHHGLTKGLLALFMGMFTLGGAAIQVPLGRLSDRVDRRLIIAAVAVVAAAMGLLLAHYGGQQKWLTLVMAMVFGITALPLYGLSVAHTNDRVPRESFIEASATLLMVNSLVSVVGPPLAAIVTGFAGTQALFYFTATIHVALAAFTLVRLQMKEAPPKDERSVFEPMPPQASPAEGELDPRNPDSSEMRAA